MRRCSSREENIWGVITLKKHGVKYLFLAILGLAVFTLLAACGERATTGGAGEPPQANNGANATTGQQTGETPGPITLKLTHMLPPLHEIHTEVLEPFAREVEQISNGRITVELYPANALGTANSHYELVETGVAEMGLHHLVLSPNVFPLTSVVELPFLVNSSTEGTELIWQLYQEFPEIQKEFSGTKVLWFYTVDPDMILTAKKQVASLDDVKGLKLRTPSSTVNTIIETWGGVPISMPIGDSYDALQRGVVDGVMAPYSTMINFNFTDVIDYVLEDTFYVSAFVVAMNKDVWDSLTPDEQAGIEGILDKYRQLSAETYEKSNAAGKAYAEEQGLTFTKLTDEELQKFSAAVQFMYDDWAKEMESKGLPGQAVLDKTFEIVGKK